VYFLQVQTLTSVWGPSGNHPKPRTIEEDEVAILDLVFPLNNLQAIAQPTQIARSVVSADFTADAACANLVRHRSVGLERELHSAALAASVQGHRHFFERSILESGDDCVL
jgi:hypothetical protein